MNAHSRRSAAESHRRSPSTPEPLVPFPRGEVAPLNLEVVVAENDPGCRQALVSALQELGCRVTEFATGVEALEAAEWERPDVLVLDVRLPDTDGLQALAEWKGEPALEDVPVAVLAPAFVQAEEEAALEAGAEAFLLKPVDIDELRAVLAGCGRARGRGAAS